MVRLMNAFMRATSVWLRLSNSDNSIIQTPQVCMGALASEVRQFVTEELAGERPQCGRFSDALRPFENETAIRFGSRPKDSRDRGDQPPGADRTYVLGILGS